MDFFINKEKFILVFKNLMENIKCKCFYKYFLLTYIKNIITIYNEINIPNIIFDGIIKNETK